MSIEKKMQELIDYLNDNTILYEQGTPAISDQAWDENYFALKELEKQAGFVLPNSPTQKIEYQIVNSLEKVTHNHPMLSLDKTKDWNEFLNYFTSKDTSKDVIGMLKLDGLTCSLRYINGKLISAETRGNGEVGENILHNAMVLFSIPKSIPYKEELVIDGEIICKQSDFQEFASEYKNPRNFAAGSIRLLDSRECAKRKLTFIVWNVVKGLNGYSFMNKLQEVESLGFEVVPWTSSFDWDAKEFLEEQAKKYGYPIDGLVGRFDDIKFGESLPVTAHHSGAAYAFKFYDETYETELEDIEWTMGRTGQLTPVAIFKEIEIDGSSVNRANMFNISIMTELLGDAPYPGQKLQVFKANAIIPQIASANKKVPANVKVIFAVPARCPICGGETRVEESDSGTLNLVCTNLECSGKLSNKIDHFLGKKGLDVKGISMATIEKLISLGWIENLSDVFNLTRYREQWIHRPGFGAKSVDKILAAIEAAKSTTLESFIAALGIPLIGRTVSKELCKHISSYEELREKVDSKFNFCEYDGFANAKTIALWEYDYTEADKIYPLLDIAAPEVSNIQKSCDGVTVVITGKLKQFKNRDGMKAWIEERGGKVTGSVTKKTDYLINNDIESTSSKNITAQQLNIPIITEDDFIEMFA